LSDSDHFEPKKKDNKGTRILANEP